MSDPGSCNDNNRLSPGTAGGVTRQDVLKGAAIAGLTGAMNAGAQVEGVMPGGGTVPFRLPGGAVDYLDRDQYIRNMEIHAHISCHTVDGGVRVYDISDPSTPQELARFVPPRDGDMDDYMSWYRGTSETVFVEWDRNLIWLGTHEGSYCLSTPPLGEPVLKPHKIGKWTIPHGNVGWDA
ncbi:MAG: hypothetical protein ACE5OQ_04040 [Woeseia sp.]